MDSDPDFARSFARFAPVTLEAINERAMLLTRIDRKYVVDTTTAGALFDAHAETHKALTTADRRWFPYESVYFDTEDFSLYLDAAYRRRRRHKVRTRSYVETEESFVEVKSKGVREQSAKQRVEHPYERRDELLPSGRAFVDEVTAQPGLGDRLSPVLWTSYHRATLLEPSDEMSSRATVDVGLRCADGFGDAVGVGAAVVVETKSSRRPSLIDRWMWRNGHRPQRISKYCTAMAALYPELPANKWHRSLTKYIEAAPSLP